MLVYCDIRRERFNVLIEGPSLERNVTFLLTNDVSSDKWRFVWQMTFCLTNDVSSDKWRFLWQMTFPLTNDVSSDKWHFLWQMTFPLTNDISWKRQTSLSVYRRYSPTFYICICILTLPTRQTTFFYIYINLACILNSGQSVCNN